MDALVQTKVNGDGKAMMNAPELSNDVRRSQRAACVNTRERNATLTLLINCNDVNL